jgi:hypothetical protein
MGDRGNIVFSEPRGGTLYFYTHWSGSTLPQTVANALDRGRNRWYDGPYLARILFCQILLEDANGHTDGLKNVVSDTTGYGISTEKGDGGTEVYVNVAVQEVSYEGETLPFEEYVAKYKVAA